MAIFNSYVSLPEGKSGWFSGSDTACSSVWSTGGTGPLKDDPSQPAIGWALAAETKNCWLMIVTGAHHDPYPNLSNIFIIYSLSNWEMPMNHWALDLWPICQSIHVPAVEAPNGSCWWRPPACLCRNCPQLSAQSSRPMWVLHAASEITWHGKSLVIILHQWVQSHPIPGHPSPRPPRPPRPLPSQARAATHPLGPADFGAPESRRGLRGAMEMPSWNPQGLTHGIPTIPQKGSKTVVYCWVYHIELEEPRRTKIFHFSPY